MRFERCDLRIVCRDDTLAVCFERIERPLRLFAAKLLKLAFASPMPFRLLRDERPELFGESSRHSMVIGEALDAGWRIHGFTAFRRSR